MFDTFFRKVAYSSTLAVIVVSGFCAGIGRFIDAWGVLTAFSWVYVNAYFLYRLLKIASEKATSPKIGRTILALALVKFPVLYVAGYFILRSGYFPPISLFVGVTVFFSVLGIVWLRFNLSFAEKGAHS